MSIRNRLIATGLVAVLAASAFADGINNPGGGSGSSTITANSTATSGGSSGCVWYNASSKMECDSGFTYAGAGGAVQTTSQLNFGLLNDSGVCRAFSGIVTATASSSCTASALLAAGGFSGN
jgi:hypothetical protein